MVTFNKEAVKGKTYTKLVMNKTHIGPVSEKVAKARSAKALSAAANKIRMAANFKVEFSKEPHEAEQNNPNYSSWLITDQADKLAGSKTGLLLMQAWDKLYKEEGTSGYLKKYNEFIAARGRAYAKLGINPVSGDRPNLTSDQRRVYDECVRPYAFDYYEYHIAFKMDETQRFVRSKTYRSIEPLDLNVLHQKLIAKYQEINSLVHIVTKPEA